MGVCEVVAELADAVAEAQGPLHHRHALMAHILRSAPVYREAGRLDAWEAAYADAAGEAQRLPVDELLDEIFKLGRYNLYGAFDAAGVRECYERLARQLREAGIRVPVAADLRDW